MGSQSTYFIGGKEQLDMKKTFYAILVGSILLAGCSLPGSATATPTIAAPAIIFITTETASPAPAFTAAPIFTPTFTPIPPVAANFCTDPQVTALVDSLKSAMLNENGSLLSSLVSPNGMEVRYFHNSDEPMKYSAYQATFLFETTYVADWGEHPASGQEKKGSFHDVVVPELKKIFNLPYSLHCNEIRHGGASYPISWPYQKDFYSIYYAGTEPNGNLDWNTWVVGIEYVNAKPFVYALTQFFWEP
jgi:hypothetical protein